MSGQDIVRSIAADTGVPAGILWGIWSNETGRSAGGWGQDGWYSPAELVQPGSRCVSRYDLERCQSWYQSLQVVCAQTRHDGTRVCDVGTVRVSVSFDLGPMQHNASSIVRRGSDGTWHWGRHVRDFNGDGVFDPNDRFEAMNASALMLRFAHDQRVAEGQSDMAAWRWAINRYAGRQYRDGESVENRQKRIIHERRIVAHWTRWCETSDACQRT